MLTEHGRCANVAWRFRGGFADVVCASCVPSAHCVPVLRGCCAEYPVVRDLVTVPLTQLPNLHLTTGILQGTHKELICLG